MRKAIILIISIFIFQMTKASPGDSIFNMTYIHNLHITFPYPNFFDSLIYTNITDEYIPVDIDFNGEIYSQVGIKVKGNSSFNNPSQKKSFKLDFNTFVQGQDMHGLKKLNFNNSFKDPSFMREKLNNDFLISHDLPAPRVTYCNVYMNNQLWGLYAIVEEIDDEFCTRWFNSNDGNLFKGDPHGTLQWKGSMNQPLYESDYELKNNSSVNDWSDLISLINVINNTPDASLPATLDQKMHTEDFIRHWVAENIFVNLDSYLGSGHNYYIYHDTVTDKFQWIAWDSNESFGSFKMNLSTSQLKNLDMYFVGQAGARPLCENLLENSHYKNLYDMAYCRLRDDFSNLYFDPIIDSLRPVIQSSVYSDPKKFYNNAKFDSSFNYDVKLPEGIVVFGLKPFIAARSVAIQNSITGHGVDCSLQVSEGISPLHGINVYPNPASAVLYIEAGIPIEKTTLYDLQGRLVRTYCITAGFIDISDVSPGMYVLRINDGLYGKIIIN
ncbi:MAG TPA: CotH kinase family protein [Bacteroidales bacterium]|nr:CotH kinase family protein [Bacteroidales bacterium]